ncbi:MAG: DUF5681 domain-containing protein [bacterium]|nr:DUF5681 domain-containing protein [bacterium]
MSNEDNGGERIGYCKPPLKNRFQKGKSGNPRGRPKKSKNFSSLVAKELDATITITEGDKCRRVTKREALAMTIVNKSLILHQRALSALLPAVEKQDDRIEQKQAHEQAQGLAEDDEELMRRFCFPIAPEQEDD